MVNLGLPSQSKGPIWVVEDDTSSQEVIRHTLVEHGYTALCFHSAEEAHQALQRGSPLPVLVLLDLLLPGMSGMELVRLIKEKPEWKSIPVVIVTSLSRHEARAENDPVEGLWLRKPVDTNELISTIKSLLAS